MLERMWRKGNLLAQLVGKLVDTATVEDSVEIPLKRRNATYILPTKPTTGHILC